MTDKTQGAEHGVRVKPGGQWRAAFIPVFILPALILPSACDILQPRGLSFPWMYRTVIQQGNLYDSEDVAELEIGMSRSEVLEIMGSPMLRDPLHKNRWDYLYLLQIPNQEPVRYHLVLLFDGDSLSEISERTPSPPPHAERAAPRHDAGASPSDQ